MFCGNCGSKIEDGAKFCANCGTPVAVEAIQQPVIESPAPAVEAVQQPVVESPAPAVEAVQQPVVESPAPAVEAIQQPAVESLAPAVEAVQQTVQPTSTPIEPLQPEQPVQNIAPAPYIQPAPVQPVMQQAAPVQPVMPVKKKKSKAPLIAGITAGAVLLGGGAAGYFLFHDDITRLFMGPKEYAKMIDRNYLGTSNTLDPISKKYAVSMLSTVDSTVHSLTKTISSSNAESSATDAAAEIANNSVGYADPTLIFSALDMIPEGSTMTVDTNFEVKLGSVFAMFDNDTTRAIIDAINNFTVTQKYSRGETRMMSYGVKTKDGQTGSVEIFTKDGGLLFTFPGISDKKIYIPKEDIESAQSKTEIASAESIKLDINEFERLKGEIVNVYYAAYDNAEITYTDNIEWVETAVGGSGELKASAKGNNVHVVFKAEQVKDMMKSMMEIIANDEYLTSYFTTNFSMSAEQYKKTFDPESFTKNVNFSLVVDHIVDVHNNVLASGYSIVPDSDKGELSIKTINTGTSGAMVFRYVNENEKNKTNLEVKAVSENKTKNDGNMVIVITPDKNNDSSFALDCEYTGKDTKKFLDRDVIVGKYVIKLSDPDRFAESIGAFFSVNKKANDGNDTVALTAAETQTNKLPDNNALLEELKKISITIENYIDGNVLNSSFGFTAGEIGSVSFKTRTEQKPETVSMPDTSGALKINDSEALSGIGKDALNWLKDLAKGIDGGDGFISKAIDKMLNDANRDDNVKKHYAAYDSNSKYNAENYANEIIYALEDQVREKIENTNERKVSGLIKIYYDNGKPEIIDDGGISGLSVNDSGIDSVYAEILYDSRLSKGIEGVTVVLTDDKNDLPDALPTIDNFAQGVYPWGENKNFIGDYVVGISPYLYDGNLDPNIVIPEPPDLDALNSYAKKFADAVLGYMGNAGSIENFADSDNDEHIIAFMHSKYSGCYDIGGYDGTRISETGGLKKSFIDGIKDTLQKIYDTNTGMPDLHMAFYFKNGLFAGVLVSESGAVYYNDVGMPKTDDYYKGRFAGWADSDEDGSPDEGYITDYKGGITPIGTYSLSSGNELKAGKASDANSTSEVWKVTALGGQLISDIAKETGVSEDNLAIYVRLDDSYAYLSSASTNTEEFPLLLTEHEDYEGKHAIGLYNEETEVEEGFIVFDSDTTARLVDTISEMTYDLEKTEAGAIGNVISNDYHDPKWGKWSGGGKTVTIGSNWLFSDITQMYASKFYYVFANPGDDETSRLCDLDTLEQIALIRYNADNDTLVVEDPDGTKTTYTRVEDAPKYAYFDVWTIDTYAGAPETEKMVFDIGQYSTEYVENSGSFAYDIIDTTETSFKIVFDSSYFLDCTYDKASDKINGVLKFDDTDETIELTMKRTPGALG